MTLVLDAGALIQVDRGNQEVLSALKVAFDKGESVDVPTGVIGQAWRNPDRQALLSRALVLALYFCILIGIAAYRSNRMANMGDYVLGGPSLGSSTAALSAGSSSASGWTMLVFPALAFAGSLMHLWTAVFIVLGMWLAWILTAKRLRRYTISADNSGVLGEALSATPPARAPAS